MFMLGSIMSYMNGASFDPRIEVEAEKIKKIIK